MVLETSHGSPRVHQLSQPDARKMAVIITLGLNDEYAVILVGAAHVGWGQRIALCQGGVLATRWSPASLGTVR